MERRIFAERRHDPLTAERVDLALKTWKAFDTRAAVTYLQLCRLPGALVDSFVARLPDRFRGSSVFDGGHRDRRNFGWLVHRSGA